VFGFRTTPPDSGLHQCPLCHGDYVVPVWWDALDDDRWQMLLRCPQCETFRDVVASNEVANEYEVALAKGMETIAASLYRSDRERMAGEVDVFIAALERDLIDAADFAPR